MPKLAPKRKPMRNAHKGISFAGYYSKLDRAGFSDEVIQRMGSVASSLSEQREMVRQAKDYPKKKRDLVGITKLMRFANAEQGRFLNKNAKIPKLEWKYAKKLTIKPKQS